MSPGPLRRLTGTLGLVALVPTAALLAMGWITVTDAALRAAVTLVGVTVIGRVARWSLSSMARQFERRAPTDDPEDRRTVPAPTRSA